MREELKKKFGCQIKYPIEWEHCAWIEAAKKQRINNG